MLAKEIKAGDKNTTLFGKELEVEKVIHNKDQVMIFFKSGHYYICNQNEQI